MIRFGLPRGLLEAIMRREGVSLDAASKVAVTEETDALKLGIRAIINRDFKGSEVVTGGNRKVANAVRSRVYPREGGGYTGQVWSKFGAGRGPDFEDYLLPFVTGMTIRSSGGGYLRIPLTRSQRGVGSRRARASRIRQIYAGGHIETRPLSGGRGFIVLDRSGRGKPKPIELLLKQVRLPKKLDFGDVVRLSELRLPQRLAEALTREDSKT